MGYDIWLEGEGVHDPGGDDPGNYTYNVDPMFALALDGDPERGIQNGAEVVFHEKDPALKRFIGRTCSQCVDELSHAVGRMEADPDTYRALNPENGWGDYDGALRYLRRLRDACEEHPNAQVAGWL